MSPNRVSLPRFHVRIGLHIVLFEIPWRVGGSERFPDKVRGLPPPILELTMNITTDHPEAPTAIRGLQTLRHLHACPGCFRLERLPGGISTHWKTPPFHGARE